MEGTGEAKEERRRGRRRRLLRILGAGGLGLVGLGLLLYIKAMPGFLFLLRITGEVDGSEAEANLEVWEAVVEGADRPVPVRVYRPPGGSDRAIVLIHGLHWGGYDEARLIPMARQIAGMGFAVVTPDIGDLKSYDIRPRAVDEIERSLLWTLDDSGLVDGDSDGKVGLMGICFAGGLGLSASTRPSLRERLAFVFAFGGHGDLDHTMEYLVTGELPDEALSEGHREELLEPHIYGQAVMLRIFADRIVPEADVEPLRALLLDYLHEEEDRVEEGIDRLGPEAARVVRLCLDRETIEIGSILAPHVRSVHSPDVLSPVRLEPPSCPVFLLHGSIDNVVPPSESRRLATWSGDRARLLISDQVVHVELEESEEVPWIDTWNLVTFWSALFRS